MIKYYSVFQQDLVDLVFQQFTRLDVSSTKFQENFSKLIKQQSLVYTNNDFQEKKLKNEIKQKETEDTKILLTQLQNQMNDNVKRLNTIPQEKGGSNWLT